MAKKMTKAQAQAQNEATIRPLISHLETMYEGINGKLFGGKLEPVVIVIQSDTTKGAYGWYTTDKRWNVQGTKRGYHEITLTAENMARPFPEIATTLVHEMVHHFCNSQGIKDTSRAGWYHNDAFRTACEEHGMEFPKGKDPKNGWAHPALTADTLAWIMQEYNTVEFVLYRQAIKKGARGTKKSNSIKYVCPCCGAIVRATKEVNIKCADCDETMVVS